MAMIYIHSQVSNINSGFNTNEIGWSYMIMKFINYMCVLILIIFYFISLTKVADFTSYLSQQITLLIFIAMAFAADYPNFCYNPATSIQKCKSLEININ